MFSIISELSFVQGFYIVLELTAKKKETNKQTNQKKAVSITLFATRGDKTQERQARMGASGTVGLSHTVAPNFLKSCPKLPEFSL